jgi:hypothetical protein
MKLIYTEARNILGDDLITPGEIARARGMVYSDQHLRHLDDTLPSVNLLFWCRTNGMALIPGPPSAMSMLDIRDLRPDHFLSKQAGWYAESKEVFGRQDVVAPGWLAFSKKPIEGSLNRNWSEQQSLVKKPWIIPNAAEVAWVLTTYKAVRGVYLLFDCYVRTSSVGSDGNHVDLGGSGCLRGLCVTSTRDHLRGTLLGVSAARRF